nr:cadherin-1-like [Paramormyrops kingsleyae]
MGTYRVLALGLIFLLQAFTLGSCKAEEPCQPRISSKLFTFNVDRAHLEKGRRLGRVLYDDCGGQHRFLFTSKDSRFKVDSDGTVLIKRPFILHEGRKIFSVHAWDSNGRKFIVRIRVQLKPQTSHVENVPTEQFEGSESVPGLEFLSSTGLKRRKRDWMIPPITILEGEMGPFPKAVVKVRSSEDKEVKMQYWITGPGADEPPKDIFTMDRNSGSLFVTQPLDREQCSSYTLMVHAAALGDSKAADPTEIKIIVSDQNDNKPVFTQDAFMGNVSEAVGAGYEILSVTATDADDPETYNADLRYSILSQDPPLPVPDMFAIDPTSGQIRLNNAQLDKKKYPQYTLTVKVADMTGEGYPATCKAIITVTE